MLEAVCVVVTGANRCTTQTKPKMVPVLVFILLIIQNLSADLRMSKNHHILFTLHLLQCKHFILHCAHEKYVCI